VTTARLTLTFAEIGTGDIHRVGGKGANLGALTRAGICVPPGFCVTTAGFDRFMEALPDAQEHFAALDALDGTSIDAARMAAEGMRNALGALAMPEGVREAVLSAWRTLGTEHALAVRSSATAEDLPGASFAGQQDTFLNVRGEASLLEAVRRCWISLFTDRAVLYRARGGFGHHAVQLSVVVQRLIDPEVSGILFTADPITGHRHIASIDAGFGLGEALVSGLISADLYRVDKRSGEVLLAQPGHKAFAIRSRPDGGTTREALPETQADARALSDEQVRALAEIGAKVEALYVGVPQDIEWCIAEGKVYVVQARPVTSLFPLPQTTQTDIGLRVYVSFGHLQMMLDPMPTLARQVWQLFLPAGKTRAPTLRAPPMRSSVMVSAGSRLYIDVTGALRISHIRKGLLSLLSRAYQTLGQSVSALVTRPGFEQGRAASGKVMRAVLRILGPVFARVPIRLLFRDPEEGAAAFSRALKEIPLGIEQRVRAAGTSAARIRLCEHELNGLFWRVRGHLAQMITGFAALALLRRLTSGGWADRVRDDVGLLMRGLPGNVTTEMDLAVGDLTDRLRPHPALAALIQSQRWADAQGQLQDVAGGTELASAIAAFLSRYGNRSAGEIDLSRPRWRDDPSLLLRVMSGGLAAGEAGVHRRQHQAQVATAEEAIARLVAAAKHGPWGWLRSRWARRLARVARIGMGLREHPKFAIVQVLAIVRAEALVAGRTLEERGQLNNVADVWHLGFDELANALEDPNRDLRATVAARSAELRGDQGRRPPLVMSSDGETPTLEARADLPEGALSGTAASAGVVEGIARVVTDPSREVVRAGEILVAPFTDPGWTPLFVHAAGLVTEVGGMMTHGAVVAREYGIPAVVSVSSAVERIKSGQRIRVDGTRGFVQILEKA
jgi:rifampicin phosphotransferase